MKVDYLAVFPSTYFKFFSIFENIVLASFYMNVLIYLKHLSTIYSSVSDFWKIKIIFR